MASTVIIWGKVRHYLLNQKDNIEIINGTASFVDNKTIRVGDQLYSGKHILIATGSYAWIPNVPGAQQFGTTSDGFFDLDYLPKRVAVAGAGYIAIELAGIFRALGMTLNFNHRISCHFIYSPK
jgi:glutathione reductase (NADPH)